MKVVIIAAGDQTRWGNYLNISKHMIKLIDEEPIIHRTIRLASKYTSDITVVAKDNQYTNEYSSIYIPELNPNNLDADKFLSSRQLWHDQKRTVIIYGDCFFTEEAMDKIMTYEKDPWTFFFRFGPSKITGCEYGENFAISFVPECHDLFESSLHQVVKLNQEERVWRSGGWETYRVMSGAKTPEAVGYHGLYRNYVEINDWTEDFDLPEDYDNWMKNWQDAGSPSL